MTYVTELISKSRSSASITANCSRSVPSPRKTLTERTTFLQFYTYRDDQNPRAQIEGSIGDRTHRVKVIFEVEETDKFEQYVSFFSFSWKWKFLLGSHQLADRTPILDINIR